MQTVYHASNLPQNGISLSFFPSFVYLLSFDSFSSLVVLLFRDTMIWTPVLSKVDDFATFKKVEVHAKNSTF